MIPTAGHGGSPKLPKDMATHPAAAALAEPVAVVRALLDQHLPHGGRALLGLSGGPDSAALALLARRARPDLDLVAVHVRHGLRDDAADACAAAEIARRLGIGFDLRAITVAGGNGPEAAARRARYDALSAAAADHRAGVVMVGHSADDQAETVLLRLARGSGTRGIGGMAPVRPLDAGATGTLLLRPLLALRRAQLAALVDAAGLPAVTDPTNVDLDQRRARARAEALPALARLAGGTRDPVPLLCRAAAHARADADALDALADEVVARELERWGPGRALRTAVLDGLPRALADRVLRALLAPACGGLPSSAAVAAVRRLLLAGPGVIQVAGAAGGARVSLGGGRLAAAALSAGIRQRELRMAGQADFPATFLPVVVPLEELGLRLQLAAAGAEPWPDGSAPRVPGAGPTISGMAAAAETLVLRGPLPGDVLHQGGHARRLAECLAGVPRALRPLIPVLADAATPGKVRWAAGAGTAHPMSHAGPAGPAPLAGRALAVRLEALG